MSTRFKECFSSWQEVSWGCNCWNLGRSWDEYLLTSKRFSELLLV